MNIFAEQLRTRRNHQNLTLQSLADLAKVSKSIISKIERDDVQPSLEIAARLAEALGTNLSEMLRHDQRARIVHIQKDDHAIARSPDGKHKRIIISPSFEKSNIEWLQITLQPGKNSGEFPAHKYGTEEHLLLLKGCLNVIINGEKLELQEGDSLCFDAHYTHEFRNDSAQAVEYMIVVSRGK